MIISLEKLKDLASSLESVKLREASSEWSEFEIGEEEQLALELTKLKIVPEKLIKDYPETFLRAFNELEFTPSPSMVETMLLETSLDRSDEFIKLFKKYESLQLKAADLNHYLNLVGTGEFAHIKFLIEQIKSSPYKSFITDVNNLELTQMLAKVLVLSGLVEAQNINLNQKKDSWGKNSNSESLDISDFNDEEIIYLLKKNPYFIIKNLKNIKNHELILSKDFHQAVESQTDDSDYCFSIIALGAIENNIKIKYVPSLENSFPEISRDSISNRRLPILNIPEKSLLKPLENLVNGKSNADFKVFIENYFVRFASYDKKDSFVRLFAHYYNMCENAEDTCIEFLESLKLNSVFTPALLSDLFTLLRKKEKLIKAIVPSLNSEYKKAVLKKNAKLVTAEDLGIKGTAKSKDERYREIYSFFKNGKISNAVECLKRFEKDMSLDDNFDSFVEKSRSKSIPESFKNPALKINEDSLDNIDIEEFKKILKLFTSEDLSVVIYEESNVKIPNKELLKITKESSILTFLSEGPLELFLDNTIDSEFIPRLNKEKVRELILKSDYSKLSKDQLCSLCIIITDWHSEKIFTKKERQAFCSKIPFSVLLESYGASDLISDLIRESKDGPISLMDIIYIDGKYDFDFRKDHITNMIKYEKTVAINFLKQTLEALKYKDASKFKKMFPTQRRDNDLVVTLSEILGEEIQEEKAINQDDFLSSRLGKKKASLNVILKEVSLEELIQYLKENKKTVNKDIVFEKKEFVQDEINEYSWRAPRNNDAEIAVSLINEGFLVSANSYSEEFLRVVFERLGVEGLVGIAGEIVLSQENTWRSKETFTSQYFSVIVALVKLKKIDFSTRIINTLISAGEFDLLSGMSFNVNEYFLKLINDNFRSNEAITDNSLIYMVKKNYDLRSNSVFAYNLFRNLGVENALSVLRENDYRFENVEISLNNSDKTEDLNLKIDLIRELAEYGIRPTDSKYCLATLICEITSKEEIKKFEPITLSDRLTQNEKMPLINYISNIDPYYKVNLKRDYLDQDFLLFHKDDDFEKVSLNKIKDIFGFGIPNNLTKDQKDLLENFVSLKSSFLRFRINQINDVLISFKFSPLTFEEVFDLEREDFLTPLISCRKVKMEASFESLLFKTFLKDLSKKEMLESIRLESNGLFLRDMSAVIRDIFSKINTYLDDKENISKISASDLMIQLANSGVSESEIYSNLKSQEGNQFADNVRLMVDGIKNAIINASIARKNKNIEEVERVIGSLSTLINKIVSDINYAKKLTAPSVFSSIREKEVYDITIEGRPFSFYFGENLNEYKAIGKLGEWCTETNDSYYDKMQRGETILFNLKDKDGHAVYQVEVNTRGKNWTVSQFQGHDNKKTPVYDEQVIIDILKRIVSQDEVLSALYS